MPLHGPTLYVKIKKLLKINTVYLVIFVVILFLLFSKILFTSQKYNTQKLCQVLFSVLTNFLNGKNEGCKQTKVTYVLNFCKFCGFDEKKNPKSRCTVHKSQGFVNHNY